MRILRRAVYAVATLSFTAFAVFLVTHAGAYPWLLDTWYFRVLALIVAANTLFYAALSIIKVTTPRPPSPVRIAEDAPAD